MIAQRLAIQTVLLVDAFWIVLDLKGTSQIQILPIASVIVRIQLILLVANPYQQNYALYVGVLYLQLTPAQEYIMIVLLTTKLNAIHREIASGKQILPVLPVIPAFKKTGDSIYKIYTRKIIYPPV